MILAMQVTMPTDGTNPYAWFLVIALGGLAFMFKIYDNNNTKRTERCEKQQDSLLADNRIQASTIKEQTSILQQIATLAESAVDGSKAAQQKLDDIKRMLEERTRDAQRAQ